MITASIVMIVIAFGMFITSILFPETAEPMVFAGYVFMVLALAGVFVSGKYRQ